ncbi:hypothetical protein DNTS_031046, partial [Danionella cerebrum]
ESPPIDGAEQYVSSPSSVKSFIQRSNQTGESVIHSVLSTPSPASLPLLKAPRHCNNPAFLSSRTGRGVQAPHREARNHSRLRNRNHQTSHNYYVTLIHRAILGLGLKS